MLNDNENTGDVNCEFEIHTAEPKIRNPTFEEIIEAVNKLKNKKSPRVDSVTAELVKNGGEALHRQIHKQIVAIWKKELILEEWKDSIIIPMFKKGDKMNCNKL